jgi:hypothetical protein
MNAIAFCLDLILATLLLAALFVGLRLDRKLKALKDSQSGFAGAVAELDAAIVKARDGLTALKATAIQAETDIADRIQDAKGMTARLDQQSAAARTATENLERLLERYLATSSAHPRDRVAEAPSRQDGSPGPLSLRDRIASTVSSGRPLAREALSRPAPLVGKSLAPHGRGNERNHRESGGADDELFDIIEPVLRAARGGR